MHSVPSTWVFMLIRFRIWDKHKNSFGTANCENNSSCTHILWCLVNEPNNFAINHQNNGVHSLITVCLSNELEHEKSISSKRRNDFFHVNASGGWISKSYDHSFQIECGSHSHLLSTRWDNNQRWAIASRRTYEK